MITLAPIAAILWENWRLTRVEALQRFGIGIVAGSVALHYFDVGALYAFWILVIVHGFFWFSIAKLNGGRFMDGYKPGFPFYLLYTRPVPTTILVGAVMAYDVVSGTILYLVSAALLGLAFGKPIPLLDLVPWIVTFHVVCLCIQWSTRNRVVQWIGSIIVGWPFYFWLNVNVTNQLSVEFSLVENWLFAAICVASIVAASAGVARQRRGDFVESTPLKAVTGGYPDWLVAVFRFRCPTSSATRAQIWFDLKSSGLPTLAIAVTVAVLIVALYAAAIPAAPLRHFAVGISFFCIPVVLFTLGGNAFGIRRRQGKMYASAFELTQPYGTQALVALKVLVRTASVVLALAIIITTLWNASALLGAWGTWFADGRQDALPNLLKARARVGEVFGSMPLHLRAALAVLACILVASVVAWSAAREALRLRYPRFQRILAFVIAGWGLGVCALAILMRAGILPETLVRTLVMSTIWLSGLALTAVTIYLLWRSLSDRALTVGYAVGALAASVAFSLAWWAAVPAGDAVGIAWFASMILAVNVVAPWALGRVRHA